MLLLRLVSVQHYNVHIARQHDNLLGIGTREALPVLSFFRPLLFVSLFLSFFPRLPACFAVVGLSAAAT